MKSKLFFIAIYCIYQSVYGFDLNFLNSVESIYGIGWPHVINVVEGNEVLLKLAKPYVDQSACRVTTPEGVTFDVNSPPSNKFESWDGCGVRVRDVVKSDEGRWRLTSFVGDYPVTGFSEVHVQNETHIAPQHSILIHDGHENQQVTLSDIPNLYCMVTQPFTESALVPGDCTVELERATRAVQGNWAVALGVAGQVAEVTIDRHVAVEAERLDVGFVHDTVHNKLNLHCNILHSNKEITFCRFQRTSSSSGFNLLDGLSDGEHSYYGDGFLLKQCGMTIENPTSADFSSWRCSVGVQELVGASYQQRPPMQALIAVARSRSEMLASRSAIQARNDEATLPTVFVERNQQMSITCNSDFPLTYCWFQAPDGTQFTPMPHTGDAVEFWYQGESLGMGDCGIVFAHARDDFSGQWTCHKGASDVLGVEETDQVNVRVTGALAARVTNIVANLGDPAELYCHSANGNRPLDYCRFLTPNNLGLNVDDSVTEDMAILDRFYFTEGRQLDHGDCSLTIKHVSEEDIGTWTCAAVVLGETVESRDTISVNTPVDSNQPGSRSRAGMAGGIFSGITLLALVLGAVAWYRRAKLPWRTTSASQIPMTDINTRTSVVSNITTTSSSSGESC